MKITSRQEPDGSSWRENSQSRDVVMVRSLYMPAAIGTLLLGGLFAGLGVLLVYLGAKGETHIRMFGANLETADVGVACMFLAAVMVIVIFRSLFKSAESMKGRNASRRPPIRPQKGPLPIDKD